MARKRSGGRKTKTGKRMKGRRSSKKGKGTGRGRSTGSARRSEQGKVKVDTTDLYKGSDERFEGIMDVLARLEGLRSVANQELLGGDGVLDVLGRSDKTGRTMALVDEKEVLGLAPEERSELVKWFTIALFTGRAADAGVVKALHDIEMLTFPSDKGSGDEVEEEMRSQRFAPLKRRMPFFNLMLLGFLQKALKVQLMEDPNISLDIEALDRADGTDLGPISDIPVQEDLEGPEEGSVVDIDPRDLLKMTRAAMMFYLKWYDREVKDRDLIEFPVKYSPEVFSLLFSSGMYDAIVEGLLNCKPMIREVREPGPDGKSVFEITDEGQEVGFHVEKDQVR